MSTSKNKPPPPRIVEASHVATAGTVAQLPPPVGVEIAFAGRSNVGKSSLLNGLLGRKGLARTSKTPGCTRAISFYAARAADGANISLVDLPGYGYAKRSKSERIHWGELIESYLMERPTLRAVAVLVDVRRGVEDEELDLLELLAQPARTSRPPLRELIVATKLDKLAHAAQKPAVASLGKAAGRRALGYSVREAALGDELWRALRKAADLEAPAVSVPNPSPR